ncbi:cellulose biosynthesis protein BcsQ [Sedimentibacter acidaminivorans]|uniref:Cellulose biosynthesis protein BcsQ n=1 Tax=Sedimentibacter acidaminivorans TaxID=913099 RepID=A0ABS4GGB3_9FIRM|nr:hypothetical protein [Sedimentibacter acidaminivorans]MBP1926738.1 cellulose biosynthesis protein BcsQ [Sedimentibacter acidaminivorans]
MNETEKAVIFSINTGIDATDYITSNQIRNGVDDLIFLNDTNNINTKEDILVYTHKLSENLDILGTGKNQNNIQKHYKKIIDLLSLAYDYILIDTVTGNDLIYKNVMNLSDLIVVCLPQDRFVYEKLDLSSFENKKIIFLSSIHNSKNEFNLSKMQLMLPGQVYTLNQNDKINQAVYSQNLYNFIDNEFKKKTNIITELYEIHKEINRLINLDNLKITYEINRLKAHDKQHTDNLYIEPEVKVIKEYKFIKVKNNIAIINLSQDAGSTFVALNIAYLLNDKSIDISVIEIPHKEMKADIYNIINIIDDEYISLAERISNNEVDYYSKSTFLKDNIKFYINNKKISKWTRDNNMEFINVISKDSTINIYDIGSQEIDESINFIFNIIDVVIVIIDPLPYKLLQAEERIKTIKKLEERNINVVYALNRYIKDLNIRDIEKYYDIRITSNIPFITPETIYSANYSNQTVYKFEKDEIFQDSLSKILNQANVLEHVTQKSDKKFKIFNWRHK